MDNNLSTSADNFLDAAIAEPRTRIRRETDLDKYVRERAEKLQAALDAGNTVSALAAGLHSAFPGVSQKTIARKIAGATTGRKKGARVGRTVGRTAAHTSPPKNPAKKAAPAPQVGTTNGTPSRQHQAQQPGRNPAQPAAPPRNMASRTDEEL